MTTDPRLLACAKAVTPEAWHNPAGPYHYDEDRPPTTVILGRQRAVDDARKSVLKWLEQEPSAASVSAAFASPDNEDCGLTVAGEQTIKAIYAAMGAQAAKELAE